MSVSTISNDASLDLKHWRGPKANNNRYEPWFKDGKAGKRTKQDDKWEFPRHRLKVLFNIIFINYVTLRNKLNFCDLKLSIADVIFYYYFFLFIQKIIELTLEESTYLINKIVYVEKKVFNILGEGCFGQVWKCEALDIGSEPGTTIVAVKTLKENATERERLDLAQELKVMKSLEPHPNVVRLLGCCTEREPMFVILEYVSGGKLQSFLRASREERNQGGPGLTSQTLTSFVYQVLILFFFQLPYFIYLVIVIHFL